MHQHELTERLLRLRGVPVFPMLTAAELAPLAAAMRSATFERGEKLLREDEPPRSFYLLISGSVTMRRRGRTIRTIAAPGGVGFLSLLARTSGGTEAVAESRTEAFEVRADAMAELFDDHFPVLLAAMRWITEQLIDENLVTDPPPYNPPADDYHERIGDRELGIVERIFLVRRTIGFKNANVNSVVRLARTMNEARLSAGETIWRPGDRSGGTVFIVKGKMDLSWEHPATRKRVTQVVGPGYIVGGGESLTMRPRWNELVTTEPAVVLHGSREGLIDVLEDDLEIALQFLSMMAGFLLMTWDRKAEAAALAGS